MIREIIESVIDESGIDSVIKEVCKAVKKEANDVLKKHKLTLDDISDNIRMYGNVADEFDEDGLYEDFEEAMKKVAKDVIIKKYADVFEVYEEQSFLRQFDDLFEKLCKGKDSYLTQFFKELIIWAFNKYFVLRKNLK